MNNHLEMDEIIPNILENLPTEIVLNDKNDLGSNKQCIRIAGDFENQSDDSEVNIVNDTNSTSKYNHSSLKERKKLMSETFNISNPMKLFETEDLSEWKGEFESESEEDKVNKSLSGCNSENKEKTIHFKTSTPNRTPISNSKIQFKSHDEISKIAFKESLQSMDLSDSSYETVFDSFETPSDCENTAELNLMLKELMCKNDEKQDAAIQTMLTENIFFPSYCCKCRLKYFETESLKPLCLEFSFLKK